MPTFLPKQVILFEAVNGSLFSCDDQKVEKQAV
jgi:hypothetical protein